MSLLLLLSACLVTERDLDRRLDADGDGYVSSEFGGIDCDDNDPHTRPDATEVCDGVDRDCNGIVGDAEDATLYYPDADGDGYGDDDDPVHACEPPDGHVERAGDCDDTRADVHPGAFDVVDDWVDNRCGDEPERTPARDAAHVVHAQTMDDASHQQLWFGMALTGAPDLTGDGLPDLAVGAPIGPYTDAPTGFSPHRGSVAVFDGPIESDRHPVSARTVLYSKEHGYSFGEAVAAGDLDGDGISDLVVGGRAYPGHDAPVPVYLFQGPIAPGVREIDPSATFTRPVTSAHNPSEGAALAYIPHFDAEHAGFAVGQADGGTVTLVRGLPTGEADLDTFPRIETSSADETIGLSLAGQGDTDGDGISDLAVGAPVLFSVQENIAAYVFRGPFAGVRTTGSADAVVREPADQDEAAGASLAWGDLDLDGYDDLVIGSGTRHRAWVLFGPVEDLDLRDALVVQGTGFDTTRVAVPGDLDGDGHPELALGARSFADTNGALLVFRGPIEGSMSFQDHAASRTGRYEASRFGDTLAVVPDMNGDGLSELVVGAPFEDDLPHHQRGTVYLFPSIGPGAR